MVVAQTAETLRVAAVEKHFGPAFLAGSLAVAMDALGAALVVCTAFYIAFALLDGKLQRRKMISGSK